MNKILILGGSGLLGKSLIRHFLSKNFKVGSLSRYDSEGSLGCLNYQVDILDYAKLEPLIAAYDIIINCTGQITYPIYDCITLNTKGIQNIIDAVKKHGKYLIHCSTVAVYGSSLATITEESKINPESVYGTIKYFAEYQIKQNLVNYTVLRISNLYSRDQTKGIFGYLLRSVHNNEKELYFNNDGSLKRYYLHIDDLSNIVGEMLEKEIHGIYNVIGNDFVTVRELVAHFERAFHYSFNVQYEDKQPIENIDRIDNSKLMKKINYSFSNSLEMYLEELSE